jgi:hypothetical protein
MGFGTPGLADDGDRAVGVVNDTVADGAQNHAGEAPETAGTDDEKLRASGGIQERLSGLIVDQSSGHVYARKSLSHQGDRLGQCGRGPRFEERPVHSTWRLESPQGGMPRPGPRVYDGESRAAQGRFAEAEPHRSVGQFGSVDTNHDLTGRGSWQDLGVGLANDHDRTGGQL